MAAGTTYVPIATQTLGSAASSVTFSSIPSTYTDLVLVSNVKNTTSNAYGKFQFNSDTGTNYSTTWLEGISGGASTGRAANDSSGYVYYNSGAATYNFSTNITQIMNYSNATTYKTVITRYSNQGQVGSYVNSWQNTSAISSITLNSFTENFQAGSTFTLYGIASA
jgi:hypothetical protein